MHPDVLWKFSAVYFALVRCILTGFAPKNHYEPYYCSNRLESALEHIVRRTKASSGGRTYLELTPYSVYHSLYGGQDDEIAGFSNVQHLNEKLDNFNQKESTTDGAKLPISKVEVAELRVRLPQNTRWVHVDKCQFNNKNHTLDTRLVFPDLSISGRIILHPLGGTCSMILRLRHAGIEFRTIPLTSNEEARKSGAASVRTDSHFSEPGFLSVFAHGCQKDAITKIRQNSKRKQMEKRLGYSEDRNYDSRMSYLRRYRPVTLAEETDDVMNFRDNFIDSDASGNARTFSDLFGAGVFSSKPFTSALHSGGYGGPSHHYHHQHHHVPLEQVESEENINDSMQQQLEQLFSMGVRSLLTTYMQKALQPAIKETLMENMGYTLSYG